RSCLLATPPRIAVSSCPLHPGIGSPGTPPPARMIDLPYASWAGAVSLPLDWPRKRNTKVALKHGCAGVRKRPHSPEFPSVSHLLHEAFLGMRSVLFLAKR